MKSNIENTLPSLKNNFKLSSKEIPKIIKVVLPFVALRLHKIMQSSEKEMSVFNVFP